MKDDTMSWFYNLKIRTKLLMGFVFVSLIASLVGYIGIRGMGLIMSDTDHIYEIGLNNIVDIGAARAGVLASRGDIRSAMDATTPEERDKLIETGRKNTQIADNAIEKYSRSEMNAETKALVEQFKNNWGLYKEQRELGINLLMAGHLDKAAQIFDGKARGYLTSARNILDQLSTIVIKDADVLNQSSDEDYSVIKITAIVVVGLGVAISIILGLFIARTISTSLNKTVVMITEISKGHLNERLNIATKDEIGMMALTMDQFADDYQKNIIGSLKRISNGEFDFEVSIKDTKDEITPSLNETLLTLRNLQAETGKLIESSLEGKLSQRAIAKNFNGGYREIVQGINNILNAVVEPINESSKVLEQLAQGDLSVRMSGDYKGDYSKIKESINTMAESFSDALSKVTAAAHATASASTEISSSAEQMAAGAQEQSSQTSEVATAVEQMAKTIIETTRNSGQASEAAKNAGMIAKEGGIVVGMTIDGMQRIADVVKQSAKTVQALGESSNQIGEIVQVIDDIADQTNLLALNAAIEAARAGEQGRGFAVVADEVRKLAERTTKATKEIALMIKQIQKDTESAVISMTEGTSEVEKGRGLADKAGQSLKQIITGAQNVVDISSQVAAASEEQSSAAEQISKNIEAITSVTQESAAGTQQIARAAEDLNRLTTNLQELLGQFKITESNTLETYQDGTRIRRSDVKRKMLM
jgi:methyl-accepting chemotaxis protein